MLVHFIGGPAHGRTESHKNPHSILRVAEASHEPIRAYREGAALPPPEGRSWTEHEHRVTKRTRRYCIAEWQPRPVRVRVSVEFNGLEFWDRDVHEKMMKFVQQEEGDGHLGRALQFHRHHYGTGALTLEWSVEAEGPADAAAVSEATETVQNRLDAALGAEGSNYVRQIAAAVSTDD